MKYWILRCEKGLTSNYHSRGSALVKADSEEEARRILSEYNQENRKVNDSWWDDTPPLKIESCEPAKDRIYIFPDAGCC